MASSIWNETLNSGRKIEEECLRNLTNVPDDVQFGQSKFCPSVYDGIMCWSRTDAGNLAVQSCSLSLYRPTSDGLATLLCEKTGEWFKFQNYVAANYSECGPFHLYSKISESELIYHKWIPILRICTHVGYGFSISTLLLSLLIFFYLKRLHCSRNYLHMHLFVSSIMRCLMSILKDALYLNARHLFIDTSVEAQGVHFQMSTYWLCKAVISLRQYFILTNYMMILMEGIYLHNLIFLKPFSEKTSVKLYAMSGWFIPLLFVIPWAILRIQNKSIGCWTREDKTTLLLEIPTGLTVIINFILFLLIVRILCLKLNSMFVQQRRVKYRKLVKATLILLPLFGVPYTISIVLYFYVSEDVTLELIWLFFDQSFSAFQGFLAALFYCLLNGDVQTEIKRRYYSVRERSQIRRCRTISHTLQSYLPNGEEMTEMRKFSGENGKFETYF
ncbi:parathyroid hormone/parathyroid hormone-related peptide receptor-like [Harmonia axyridis]|uniref:parathyroid hormone/parathyroid hormone-related peptide receptor-like n=1 Tax=Harmonia axyridis TaxID=115357 RepID=UPI001E2750BF|nr:parathyroid hormone/parathyroid hormone-related peptide receptor-like [Harmonia axyridis]XP_045479609.1 parathyroid hormone/parathyroid hormone-related peptide receptor-like [Harmonia axyridis]